MLNENNMHAYQWTGVDHVLDNTHSALFLDMGLGKTVTTLTVIKRLIYEELEIDRVLVIAPKRVAESVWLQETKKWGHLNDLSVSIVSGSEQQRKAALAKKADIYTLGRDNVAWLCGIYGNGKLPFDMLVIDELSSFKNPKSVRFKALRAAQPFFKRIVGLTGTPAPNGLIDLWSQIFLLDRGDRLGRFITTFRSSFFRPAGQSGHIVYKYALNKGGEEEIYRRIGDICMSMKAKDYLDMPERIDNFIKIDLGKTIKEKYDLFEMEQVLSLFENTEGIEDDLEEITAFNAAALSNKLLQFANGAVYDADKVWHEMHDKKIQETKDIIENANGKPVLIAWTYKHDLERLEVAMKAYKPRQLKTDQDILDWNDGKVQVLMMHPASGGHGLNLQGGGNIIIWFGQTWSLELYEQFNARLHRQGQTESVIVNHLVAMGTIDEDVLKALEGKATTQNGLMEAVRARIKKYLN